MYILTFQTIRFTFNFLHCYAPYPFRAGVICSRLLESSYFESLLSSPVINIIIFIFNRWPGLITYDPLSNLYFWMEDDQMDEPVRKCIANNFCWHPLYIHLSRIETIRDGRTSTDRFVQHL